MLGAEYDILMNRAMLILVGAAVLVLAESAISFVIRRKRTVKWHRSGKG